MLSGGESFFRTPRADAGYHGLLAVRDMEPVFSGVASSRATASTAGRHTQAMTGSVSRARSAAGRGEDRSEADRSLGDRVADADAREVEREARDRAAGQRAQATVTREQAASERSPLYRATVTTRPG